MQINLIAVGTKMPDWIQKGFNEYAKRMPVECTLSLNEIPTAQRSKNMGPTQILDREGEEILKAIPKNNRIIALDVLGHSWNTEQLAEQLNSWMQTGRDISLLIGGAEGLSQKCLEKAEIKWSLSPLTFPHLLVRVIVAEQLYRASSILKHHPYHRG